MSPDASRKNRKRNVAPKSCRQTRIAAPLCPTKNIQDVFLYRFYFSARRIYPDGMVSAPKKPVKPGGKRAGTRQALIDAAVALVREQGFANVTMEAVAARAGVSRGSIYGNFRDRN